MKRFWIFVSIAILIVVVCLSFYIRSRGSRSASSTNDAPVASQTPPPPEVNRAKDEAPTRVYAHNLMLRKGPDFRIYVPWLDADMVRTRKNFNPSFDDPDSFVLEVKGGVIHANIGDISHFLNAGTLSGSPLKNISISGLGNQVSLHGTVHKLLMPLPIEMRGTISTSADNRIHLHVDKLSVLKLPLKRLLGGFHVSIADLMRSPGIPGVAVSGDDIYFDTQKLLPPPHIHGRLTSALITNPDIEVVYGGAQNEPARARQWHNFLQLEGGTLDFGKLTMHNVDLIMIDASKDVWFDLDLVNYQAQLVNGYTRMTPQAGLEIFMPDSEGARQKGAFQSVTSGWLKNRNLPLPPDVNVK